MDEKRLFGELAIQMGYVTAAEVRQALEVQRQGYKSGEGQKLIGVLLVELGFMTSEQVLNVLEAYDKERLAHEHARNLADTEDNPPDPFLGGEYSK